MRFLRDHDALKPYQAEVAARFRTGERHWEAVTSPLPQELDLTSFLAASAERWLTQRTGERPWFLQLSFVQPHVPLMGDPVWAEHYADIDIARTAPAVPVSDDDAWSDHLAVLRSHSRSELLTDDYVLAGARQYYAMVSLIDQKIGELLHFLDQREELEDTLIVYAADHGEMLGDHGLMAKMSFYRSSVRVPLIVRRPGGSAPVVHDGPVQAFDMVGTMLDAAGVQLEGSPARSLLPLLDGAASHRDAAVSMIRIRPGMPTWVAVTDGGWRLTFDRDTGRAVELFDLESDPDEMLNRSSTASGDHVERLRSIALAAIDGDPRFADV
jgi:choline-sulfatase